MQPCHWLTCADSQNPRWGCPKLTASKWQQHDGCWAADRTRSMDTFWQKRKTKCSQTTCGCRLSGTNTNKLKTQPEIVPCCYSCQCVVNSMMLKVHYVGFLWRHFNQKRKIITFQLYFVYIYRTLLRSHLLVTSTNIMGTLLPIEDHWYI